MTSHPNHKLVAHPYVSWDERKKCIVKSFLWTWDALPLRATRKDLVGP